MSALRQARDARDREDRGRDRGRGRGSVLNYYDDVGFATTERGHEEFIEHKQATDQQRALVGKQIQARQGEVNKFKSALAQDENQYKQSVSQINQAKSEIQRAREATNPNNIGKYADQFYNSLKDRGTLTKVHVVSGTDNKVEGTYWVAKGEQLNKMMDGLQFKNRNPKTGEWYVHTKQHGRTMGQEMHDIFRGAHQQTKTEAKKMGQEQFAEEAASAYGNIKRAEKDISVAQQQANAWKARLIQDRGFVERAQGEVKIAKEQLKGFAKQDQKFLVDLQDKYTKKVDGLRRALGQAEVETKTAPGGAASIYDQVAQGSQSDTITAEVIQGQNIPVAEAGVPTEEMKNG